jgi:hypothetical protein
MRKGGGTMPLEYNNLINAGDVDPETRLENDKSKKHNRMNEQSFAPGITTDDQIEEKTSAEEIKQGDSTSVTRLYLDRTPED